MQIAVLLLQRPHPGILRKNVIEQWGLSTRQADRYIREAKKMITAPHDEEAIASLRDEHISLTRDLYHRMYKDGKYRQALDVLRYESDLMGLAYGIPDHLRAVLAAGYEVSTPTNSD